jgi:hypothetical protein
MKFDLNHYGEFQKAYQEESDRSVAILASSYLEKYLEDYIARKLVDDKAVAKLFEGFGPLSTFNAKIEFAFAIGLLPRHVYTDLRTIRRVRNLFAHEPESSNFLTEPIRKLCATLWRVPRSDGSQRKEQKPRNQFLFSVFLAIFHMDTEGRRVSRLTIPRFHFEEVVEEGRIRRREESGGGRDSFTVRSVP